jgi:hypothetical protein
MLFVIMTKRALFGWVWVRKKGSDEQNIFLMYEAERNSGI